MRTRTALYQNKAEPEKEQTTRQAGQRIWDNAHKKIPLYGGMNG
ncbi:hypothetical protein HMPREF0758_4256 [Serratia odorifera DSM 4582]|uniref:Uncharacterized protein n=1 Tax=Serratia odorifera DSM 4582 TaxID=667129 RepID=D4E7V6_SEROD|nr:hypothetical protein HMPREF0758_4256 [Serratia odorifera DSM 4582]